MMRKEDKIDMIGNLLWKLISRFMLAIIALVLPGYGLYGLFVSLDHSRLAWLTIALVLALPLFALGGYSIAKLEVRGFIRGVERAIVDLGQAVDLRDNARLVMHQKLQEAAQRRPNDFTVGPAQNNNDAIEL